MSHAVENPIEGDMFSSLQVDNEVQTTTSVVHKPNEALVRKMLHPPSAVPEYCGLPTNDARSQVHIEWRNFELMSTPYIVDTTTNVVRAVTAADLTTFNYAFLIPNGARVKSIGYINNATADNRMMQDLDGVMYEQLYNFNQWREDVNLYRPTFRSTTFYLNATAFNDTGMVVGNQFNPNILFAGTLLELSATNPTLFYACIKSGIARRRWKIEPRPTREQTSTWEALPHYHRVELLRQNAANPTDIIDLDPNTSHQIINIGRLSTVEGAQNVPTASQILGNSLRSLGCKAKEGMFTVQRLNTITPSWLAGSNTNSAPSAGIWGLYECWTAEIDGATGAYLTEPLLENAAVGTPVAGLKPLYDTLWSKDMTWSWVLFSGLALNSQTSLSTQLLIKKTFCGYEVQPCLASAWSGMMRLAPKPDLVAMQAMMDGFYELKDVMPARYNFWGTIASMAASGLKTLGSDILTNLASKLIGGKSEKKQKKKSQKPKQLKQKPMPPETPVTSENKSFSRLAPNWNPQLAVSEVSRLLQNLSTATSNLPERRKVANKIRREKRRSNKRK